MLEPSLAQQLARVQELLDASSDGFWDWDIVSGHVRFSPRWAEMLGYRLEEIEPHVRSWEVLVHPEDMPEVVKVLQAHLRGETPYYQTEHRVRAKSGEWVWIIDRGRVVERDEAGQPLRACGAHITARKSSELERERIYKGRENLLAIVSHELRNPLQVITHSVELIRRTFDLPQRTQLVPKALETIRPALQRMLRLVTDLLDMTQLESGRLVLQPRELVAASLLEAAAAGAQAGVQAKGLTLRVNYPQAPAHQALPVVMGDFERLVQVLANLLDNAIKFSPRGGVVTLQVEPEPDGWCLSVSDEGPGIAPDDRTKVFEPFWQAKETAFRGIGLGLHIARGIVTAHGGTIGLAETASGTRVFVRLPALPPRA